MEAEPAKAAPAAEPPAAADAPAVEASAPSRKLSLEEQAAEHTIAQLGSLCSPELAAALRDLARFRAVRSELERRLAQAKSRAQAARTVEEAMEAGAEIVALQAALPLLREPELPMEAAQAVWHAVRAQLAAADMRLNVPKPRYLELVAQARLFRQEMPVRLLEDAEAQRLYNEFQERYENFRKALNDLERRLDSSLSRPTAETYVKAAAHAKAVLLAQLLPPLEELAERTRRAVEKANAARREAGLD